MCRVNVLYFEQFMGFLKKSLVFFGKFNSSIVKNNVIDGKTKSYALYIKNTQKLGVVPQSFF